MHSNDPERATTKARAIEKALSVLGEPIMEAQAKDIAALEDCDCKDGMFALAATRRQLFAGPGLVAAVGNDRHAAGQGQRQGAAWCGRIPCAG